MTNEEEKKEYLSCNIIEHGFDAQVDSINLCCRISKESNGEKIILLPNYKGEKIDWDSFFRNTDFLRNYQKKGLTNPQCKGCIYLEKKVWDDEHYISSININNWIKCNANCVYCDRKEYKQKKEYKIFPLIKNLIEKKYLKMPVDITIAGGEPTIYNDFNKLLSLLITHKISPVRVLTNAIKYNKYIEQGLKEGLVNILVSTDSGTSSTYKAVKLVDKHKAVWNNIKKYATIQKDETLVKTKYIIIPELNDSEEEIKEFIKRNKEANIKQSCIDIEINWFCKNTNNANELNRLHKLYLLAKELGEKENINIFAFDRMSIVENKIKT